MGYDKFNAGGSPVTVLRQWCGGGGGGSRNTPSHVVLQVPG